MPELKSWYLKFVRGSEDRALAHGVVSGHESPRCYDGSFIHTTSIQSITECGETLEIRTRNTLYTVRKEDVSMGADFEEDTALVLKRFLGGAAQDVIGELSVIRENKRAMVDNVRTVAADRLNKGQLFLALSSDKEYYFDYAIYRDVSGELIQETRYVHVGMSQDSVLLNNSDVRYFPYQRNSLEFYNSLYLMTDAGEEAQPDGDDVMGYILNTGSSSLKVRFTWGKTIEIKPDYMVTVSRNNINWLADAKLGSQSDMYPIVMISDNDSPDESSGASDDTE